MMKHTTNCPHCHGWKDEKRGRITSFVMAGVRHYLPDMWLASRTQRLGDGKDALFQAMSHWANQCELEGRFEAEQAREVA